MISSLAVVANGMLPIAPVTSAGPLTLPHRQTTRPLTSNPPYNHPPPHHHPRPLKLNDGSRHASHKIRPQSRVHTRVRERVVRPEPSGSDRYRGYASGSWREGRRNVWFVNTFGHVLHRKRRRLICPFSNLQGTRPTYSRRSRNDINWNQRATPVFKTRSKWQRAR